MKLKIKSKIKNNHLICKVKIPSDYIININQSNLLSRKYNFGFLELSKVKKNKLEFIGSKGISLYKRLSKPISEYDFFFMVEQIVDVTQKLENIGLSRNNLIFDLNYIMFNEMTKEISFVYLPIATPHSGTDILEFIEQLIYSVKAVESDANYLSKFSYFIKKLDGYNAEKIEGYIHSFNDDIVKTIKKEIVNDDVVKMNNQIITDNDATDLMPQDDLAEVLNISTDSCNGDEPTDYFDNDASTDYSYVNEPKIVSVGNEKNELFTEDENTLLTSNEDTELLLETNTINEFNVGQSGECVFPTLVRCLTDEIIKIDKPVFRIGKEENCVDYIVTNNIAISRSHADIISRGSRYYIFDLRSKNKSYINNRVLPAEYEVEIFNGDILKLANEEFIFQV